LPRLNVSHRTTYTYSGQVSLHPHRMQLRPREGRDLKILSNQVSFNIPATVSWAHDVFGNAIATASFGYTTNSLVIDCATQLELDSAPWPIFDIALSAMSYPFRYSGDEWTDLGALSVQQYPDTTGQLRQWAQGFVRSSPTDTLSLLKDLSNGVSNRISYQSRDVEGSQTPVETLDRGWGSCRDMAILFLEAVRCLGFGGRIVSGYLYNPDFSLIGSGQNGLGQTGSTHAWAEVFVPGAGWISFDPTNRSLGGANLIPVAVGRRIEQVTPVAGSFFGPGGACLGMMVEVVVSAG
jgi:transglutaminase-like putative cysteine protease